MSHKMKASLSSLALVLSMGLVVACDPVEPPEQNQDQGLMSEPGQAQQPGSAEPGADYNSGQQQKSGNRYSDG